MISKPLVGIIDISINNILSIKRAFQNIGSKVIIIDEQRNVEKFDIIVLPGVGAYHEAMKKLRDTKLILPIEQALNKNKIFLGICLGMQLLFEESEEFGLTKGIGFFKGKVKIFKFLNIYPITKYNQNNFKDAKNKKWIQNSSFQKKISRPF